MELIRHETFGITGSQKNNPNRSVITNKSQSSHKFEEVLLPVGVGSVL